MVSKNKVYHTFSLSGKSVYFDYGRTHLVNNALLQKKIVASPDYKHVFSVVAANCKAFFLSARTNAVQSKRRNDNYRAVGDTGFPVIGVQCRICDANDEGIGELQVKGSNVMLGYYNNPEATAEVFDKDGFFHTGDYGKLDEEGWIYITGRLKNIIILANGKNVYPEEIENELVANGILRLPKLKNATKKKDEPLPFREYFYQGFKILVGRNNLQNDRLLRLAKPDDIWLHAQKYHSSHVLILTDGKPVPDALLQFAGEVCGYFGKCRKF